VARTSIIQRLRVHESRIDTACVYCERGYIMVGKLTAIRWAASYLELDLSLTESSGGQFIDSPTLTVGCARPYLVVNDHALLACGHVSWTLLTEPARVREFAEAVTAGLQGAGSRKLLRNLARA